MPANVIFYGKNKAGEDVELRSNGGCLGHTGKLPSQVERISYSLEQEEGFVSVDRIRFLDINYGFNGKKVSHNPISERILNWPLSWDFIKEVVLTDAETILKKGYCDFDATKPYNQVMLAMFHLRSFVNRSGGSRRCTNRVLSFDHTESLLNLGFIEKLITMGTPMWKAYVIMMAPSSNSDDYHHAGFDSSCIHSYKKISVARMKEWMTGKAPIEFEGEDFYTQVIKNQDCYVRNITSRMHDLEPFEGDNMYKVYREMFTAMSDASTDTAGSDVFGGSLTVKSGSDKEILDALTATIDKYFGE